MKEPGALGSLKASQFYISLGKVTHRSDIDQSKCINRHKRTATSTRETLRENLW